jgi:hypothetical protein
MHGPKKKKKLHKVKSKPPHIVEKEEKGATLLPQYFLEYWRLSAAIRNDDPRSVVRVWFPKVFDSEAPEGVNIDRLLTQLRYGCAKQCADRYGVELSEAFKNRYSAICKQNPQLFNQLTRIPLNGTHSEELDNMAAKKTATKKTATKTTANKGKDKKTTTTKKTEAPLVKSKTKTKTESSNVSSNRQSKRKIWNGKTMSRYCAELIAKQTMTDDQIEKKVSERFPHMKQGYSKIVRASMNKPTKPYAPDLTDEGKKKMNQIGGRKNTEKTTKKATKKTAPASTKTKKKVTTKKATEPSEPATSTKKKAKTKTKKSA